MLFRATYTITSTATTTQTTCSATCACPNCGYMFDTGNYVVVRSDPLYDFSLDDEIVLREPPVWPRPQSDRYPQRFYRAPRRGFDRPGRELRHRGMFRNFHK